MNEQKGDELVKKKLTERRVRKIMELVPEARDNDWVLIMEYLKNFHPEYNFVWNNVFDLKFLTPLESITRARRTIQYEYGKMRALPHIEAKRKKRQEVLKEVYGNEEA